MRHTAFIRSRLPAPAAILTAAILSLAGAVVGSAHESTANSAPAAQALTDEAPFLAENSTAMDKMMADMDVKPTGDVDADFVATMIPHHNGAIDMAKAVLRHGKNEQIRRIAQEIIVEQQQEIVAMRLALGQPLPPSKPAPTQIAPTYERSTAGDAFDDPHVSMPMSPINR